MSRSAKQENEERLHDARVCAYIIIIILLQTRVRDERLFSAVTTVIAVTALYIHISLFTSRLIKRPLIEVSGSRIIYGTRGDRIGR